MTIADAISKRVINLCKHRNISINKLATQSYLTQSTVQSLINGDSQNPKMMTLVHICNGLGITLSQFFDDDLFNDIKLNI